MTLLGETSWDKEPWPLAALCLVSLTCFPQVRDLTEDQRPLNLKLKARSQHTIYVCFSETSYVILDSSVT